MAITMWSRAVAILILASASGCAAAPEVQSTMAPTADAGAQATVAALRAESERLAALVAATPSSSPPSPSPSPSPSPLSTDAPVDPSRTDAEGPDWRVMVEATEEANSGPLGPGGPLGIPKPAFSPASGSLVLVVLARIARTPSASEAAEFPWRNAQLLLGDSERGELRDLTLVFRIATMGEVATGCLRDAKAASPVLGPQCSEFIWQFWFEVPADYRARSLRFEFPNVPAIAIEAPPAVH